jgi:hypothetical protein
MFEDTGVQDELTDPISIPMTLENCGPQLIEYLQLHIMHPDEYRDYEPVEFDDKNQVHVFEQWKLNAELNSQDMELCQTWSAKCLVELFHVCNFLDLMALRDLTIYERARRIYEILHSTDEKQKQIKNIHQVMTGTNALDAHS